MSAKNSLKGYVYQVNVLNAFVAKMDLKRNIKNIESEAEVEHEFDDMVVIDENDNIFCFQVKDYEKFDINKVTIEDEIVKIVAGNTRSSSKFDPTFINGLIVNKDFECDNEILGFKSKVIDGIHVIPLTENNYDEQVGEHVNNSRKEFIQTQVINKISNALFEFKFDELPKLSLFSNDLKHETVKFNKIPEVINGLSWYLGAPGTGKSHWAGEIDEFYENSRLYRFYADEHDQKRLEFDRFIEDFTHRIFEAPEKKSYDEIVDKIIEDDLIILIDGLDHVYNYNSPDLEKFLEFFDILKDTKTLIFSRPFPEIIENDNVFSIEIWNKKDTIKYLEHYGFEREVNEKIYDLTNGYPIITYYLAEHYKKHKDLSRYSSKIESINGYYKTILNDIRLKKPLDLFLFCNSYILESEIKELLHQNDSENLLEFIETYPFLFSKELNRLHLFHDSFFTYLREESQMDYEYPLEKVKESILSKNINFLSRFQSFEFDDDFIKKVLKLYCNFDTFKELSKNFDFESVKVFYISLKSILPKYDNVLDIYQYYSFILITIIVERQDYHHFPELFYNIFKYADRNNINQNKIYSDGVLWSLYVYYKTGNIELYEKQLEKVSYDENSLKNGLIDSWNYENEWTLDYNNINYQDMEIREYLIESHEHEIFEKYLAYIYITDKKDSDYYSLISNYIQGTLKRHHEDYFNDICEEFKIIPYFKKTILKNAKIKIYEHGLLESENIFLNQSLNEFMKTFSNLLSCDSYDYLIGYIRLYNHLGKNFDYGEIFKFLNMYIFSKDHSVITLERALLTFERHGCINECDSVKLIKNTMQKSEDGIRGLLTSYLNQKPPEFIEKIDRYWDKLNINIENLSYNRINFISPHNVARDLKYVLSSHTDYNSIKELLNSKYKYDLLNILQYSQIIITNVPVESIDVFKNNNITFEISEDVKEENNENRNYLIETDLESIKQKKIDYLELSYFTDYYHNVLPYMDFFRIYNPEKLRKDCLKIIHNVISAKERYFNEYAAIQYNCLGNIPYLLDMINYDVEWKTLFKIMITYLEESSIYL